VAVYAEEVAGFVVAFVAGVYTVAGFDFAVGGGVRGCEFGEFVVDCAAEFGLQAVAHFDARRHAVAGIKARWCR